MTGRPRDQRGREEASSVRRGAVLEVVRAAFVVVVILVAYFTLPLTSPLVTRSGLFLVLVLVVISLLIVWEIREIVRSPYPVVKAVVAMAVTLPLFIVGFATTYFLMERSTPGAFSEPLTRLDAIYFTVTVFATVGFGDIVAKTQLARAVTLTQMVLNLVLVGLIVRAVLGAAQEGRRRRQQGDRPE